MTLRKTPAPLTPASERRMSLRAKSMLNTASRLSYLDKHNITIAVGYLLRVAMHTGETAKALMTRLRITETRRALIERAGSRLETYKGDHAPPVIKRFMDINKTKPSCVRGHACTCTQELQRVRCGNYRRGDPAAFDFLPGGEPWDGGDYAPRRHSRKRKPRLTQRGGQHHASAP